MGVPPSKEPLSPSIREQVDARCEEFERAWIAKKSPKMEKFLDRLPEAARADLLRALLTVEMEYRRDSDGGPLSEEQLLEAHPHLANDLVRAFRELRALGTKRAAADDQTLRLPSSAALAVARAETIEHTPGNRDSRGLRIRCPHCSNQVELLADTPYEDINCSVCGSTFNLVDRGDATQMLTPLKTVDRFDLIARLGVGGFGTVWKARDRELDRTVAVKIPRRGQLGAAEVEQFFREARAAAQLRHANIVPVHEVGRDGETLFIVSDFVRGVTLSDWLTGRRPSPWEVAEMSVAISDALHHAHQHGVVHRDLKPSNIMVDEEGQPHIMDFGLAKREVGEITMTVDGQILGTPAYMSPEQAGGDGRWTDRRTDIYSLGVILFEMLSGELPFRGNAQMQVHQRLTQDAPDPRNLNRHIPADLATICVKCLEREPGRRYSTAADVAAEFRRFMNGVPILARPISAPARLARWAKRKPMVATTAALTIFLAVAGPLTALAIERQRNRLAELVGEKNNLIDRYATEKQADAGRIADLTKQLDLWEGRAKPWDYWPPKQQKPTRGTLLSNLFNHASATLAGQLQDSKYHGEEAVRGALGMAIMADGTNQAADAIHYYEVARDQLMALREEQPQQSQLSRALAECDTSLARLVGEKDRAAAEKLFEEARAIRETLAKEHPDDLTYQFAWFEAEIDCAEMSGLGKVGVESAQRLSKVNKSLANWPSDPTKVYQLACVLADREPVLAITDQAEGP